MSCRRNRIELAFVSAVIALSAFIAFPQQSMAQTFSDTARLPILTVKDSTMTTVGQVIGWDKYLPFIIVEDGAKKALLRVSSDSLSTKQRVFYTNNDCTGTAYLPNFDSSTSSSAVNSFDEIEQVVYAIGKPTAPGGSIGVLLKGSGTTVEVAQTNSEWISENAAASRCFVNTKNNVDRFTVASSTDIDALFTPPFQVE